MALPFYPVAKPFLQGKSQGGRSYDNKRGQFTLTLKKEWYILTGSLTSNTSTVFLQVCERFGVLWYKLECGKLSRKHVPKFLHLERR